MGDANKWAFARGAGEAKVGNLRAWAGLCQAQDQAHIMLNKSRPSQSPSKLGGPGLDGPGLGLGPGSGFYEFPNFFKK